MHEDHFLVKVIDQVTTAPVVPGAAGEIVITTLTREATPLIRYRTRDIGSIVTDRCAMRTEHRPEERDRRRRADLTDAGGVRFFPSQVEPVLLAHSGVGWS